MTLFAIAFACWEKEVRSIDRNKLSDERKRSAVRSARNRWRCALLGFGIPFTLVSLCCCFDADATVWRLVDDAATTTGSAPPIYHGVLDGGAMERVAMRELAISDSVLTVNPWTREPAWEPVVAKARVYHRDVAHHRI